MNMVSMIYVFVLSVEIVKRTPLEQQVVEFEKRGACSCHAPLGFSAMVIGCLMTSSVSIVR